MDINVQVKIVWMLKFHKEWLFNLALYGNFWGKTRDEEDGSFVIEGSDKIFFVQNRLICFDANGKLIKFRLLKKMLELLWLLNRHNLTMVSSNLDQRIRPFRPKE